MAIHITKRELKIKTGLLITLVVILGATCILYAAFCRGKGYNKVPVAVAVSTAPTEENTEIPTEPVTESQTVTPEPESEPESESEPERESFISWDTYDPLAVLSGDEWMLALINSNHPIGKSYSPVLAPVIEGSKVQADSRVAAAYSKMYNDAKAENIILAPYAGYIPYYLQQENYNNQVKKYVDQGLSEEEAKQIAATKIDAPGVGESGAGLSVDIIGTSSDFDKTKEYAWLTANAHKYGFILRYPDSKVGVTGISSRPWHWRYVGVDAATEIKTQNLCLEEYLENKR